MRVKSRKEVRKELRKAKKLKKHEFFLRKRSIRGENKSDHKERPKVKKNKKVKVVNDQIIKSKRNDTLKHHSSHKINAFKTPQDRIDYDRLKEKVELKKLDEDMQKARIEKLKADNEKEDLEIKKLEKQMKLKNGKTSKAFVLDGLDYLLDLCDKKTSSFEETFQESDTDFKDDYDNIVGKQEKNNSKTKNYSVKQIDKKNNFNTEDDDNIEDYSDDDDKSFIDSSSEGSSDSECLLSDDDDYDDDEDDGGINDDYGDVVTTTMQCPKTNKEKDKKLKKIIEIQEENKSNNVRPNKNSSLAKKKKVSFQDNEIDSGENEIDIDEEEINTDCRNSNSVDENQKLWEDIYGRTRDESGNVLKTYVPPHLRMSIEDSNEKNENAIKLKRQLKGLLNKLAESNMVYISNQVEQLYMNNSRNSMNKTLFSLFQDSLFAQNAITPDRLISEHAMLIAILHSNIGSEIGAYFLQNSVMELVKSLESHSSVSVKTEYNLFIFILHLYNFQIFHCKLIYDIIYMLMKNFDEKEIELILLALKTVGFTLRKNDPLALKNLIHKVQEKINNMEITENCSRVNFMLEMLMAIKNNNISKIPNYNPELVEKLRKSLRLFIRKGNYSTELNISLEDLLNAEKNGRWWIVGSAWSGPLPQSNVENVKANIDSNNTKFSQKLLDLAKKQRMNTDCRKNIFCILMSSEDFLEAFERLLKLKLKGSIEREIMNVLLHCTLQEKTSNPYYMYLALKFCQLDRKYQIMLQCAIWDKIKEIDGLLPNQVTNLAKFVGHIILEKGLPLTVLKVIEFSELNKRTVKFMRQVLLTILLNENRIAAIAVFKRIAHFDKLKLFRESISLFLQQFLLKNIKNFEEKDVNRLTEMIKVCKSALYSFDDGAEY